MIRFLAALAFGFCGALAEEQLNPPPPAADFATAAVMRPAGASLVVYATNPLAMRSLEENETATREMTGAIVRGVTGKSTTLEAWRSLIKPGARVGIKVTTAGGPLFSTRKGVVRAVIAGLREAGVKEIIVWDRESAKLKEAGFTAESMGCEVRGIDPPHGWDPQAIIQAPVLGRLIWGDWEFAQAVRERGEPLSAESHIAGILTQDVDVFVNIAALSDEPNCGIAGALYSAVVGNVDNWRRLTNAAQGGAASLPEVYGDTRIGGKCVLHILDALAAVYAGGPAPNPANATVHQTLYASRDAVALDVCGLRLLERWRLLAKLGEIGTKAAWLEGATIGNSDPRRIQLQPAK